MPKLDGLSATMKIRQAKNISIIILSAKSEDSDKILGLSMGADDYVTKPFNPLELMARVKSQLRRYMTLGDVNVTGKTNILKQPLRKIRVADIAIRYHRYSNSFLISIYIGS